MKTIVSIFILGLFQLNAAKQPNILFIYTDDHSQNTISSYCSKINKTPNIDTLAREGMQFNQSFVVNSICGPARACILSGLYSQANGQTGNRAKFRQDIPIFPEILQQNNYQTAMIGKWHVSGEPKGFDYWAISHGYYVNSLKTNSGKEQVYGYTTEVLTDKALNWIEARDEEKPFMLWLCHNAVHRSFIPGPDYLKNYDDTTIPEPTTLFDDYKGKNPGAPIAQMQIAKDLFPAYDLKLPVTGDQILDSGATRKLGNMNAKDRQAWDKVYGPKNKKFKESNLSGKALTSWNYQRYMKDYLRCVDAVDDSVGRILRYLKETGLDKNTIVIYSADQGFYLGEHGWYDKRWMYEPSMRTPLIVKWPNTTKSTSQNENLVQNIDMAPTILAMAGAKIPESMHGKSLVPLLKSEQPADWRDAVYYHYQMDDGSKRASHRVAKHYGVRTDQYKLIYFYEYNFWELYDLDKDPDEMKNLADNPEYQTIVKSLKTKLTDLRTKFKEANL